MLLCHIKSRMGHKPQKMPISDRQDKVFRCGLNAKEATAEIHADQAKAILDIRQPRSTAEASSQCSLVLYCAPFLPCLKKILLPILKMVQSGEFKWEQCHAKSFSELKLLIVKPKA